MLSEDFKEKLKLFGLALLALFIIIISVTIPLLTILFVFSYRISLGIIMLIGELILYILFLIMAFYR